MTLYLERTQLAEERDIQKENQNIKQNTMYHQQPTNLRHGWAKHPKAQNRSKMFYITSSWDEQHPY